MCTCCVVRIDEFPTSLPRAPLFALERGKTEWRGVLSPSLWCYPLVFHLRPRLAWQQTDIARAAQTCNRKHREIEADAERIKRFMLILNHFFLQGNLCEQDKDIFSPSLYFQQKRSKSFVIDTHLQRGNEKGEGGEKKRRKKSSLQIRGATAGSPLRKKERKRALFFSSPSPPSSPNPTHRPHCFVK